LESIARYTRHTTEVILAQNDLEEGEGWQKTLGKITVKCVGTGLEFTTPPQERLPSRLHALGLHYALQQAANDHVLVTDPDLFFCAATDEIYLRLMEKHNLFAVGVSTHKPPLLVQTFFPCPYCMLLRKSRLPGPEFLAGSQPIRLPGKEGEEVTYFDMPDGKYLVPGPLKEHWLKFPNPKGTYDTTCNLWLWCQQNDWRWLSFQTVDWHNYYSNLYRTNFGLRDKLPRERLLYHLVGGTTKINSDPHQAMRALEEAWKENLGNET